MHTYIISVMILFALDVVGKLFILYKRDTQRTMKQVVGDTIITAAFLVWGALVIGGN